MCSQLHRDLPNNYDAWDIDPFHAETCEEIGGLTAIEVVEHTELRGTVRVERKFGSSWIIAAHRIVRGLRADRF